MDADDLFRKLTSGAKFNFKKYSSDALKLKVCVFLVDNFLICFLFHKMFLSVYVVIFMFHRG